MYTHILILFAVNVLIIAASIVIFKPEFFLTTFFLLALFSLSPLYNGITDNIYIPLGSIYIYIHDILLMFIYAIIIKAILLNNSKLIPHLFTNASLFMFIFIVWHIFRAIHGYVIVGYTPESIMRITSNRWFSLMLLAVPLIESTKAEDSLEIQIKKIVYLCGLLLPLFGLINMVIHPEGIEVTSSGTARFLHGISNIFLGLAFFLAYADFENDKIKSLKSKLILLAYMGWIFLGCLLTQHRSFLIAFAFALLFDIIMFTKDKKILTRKIIILAICIIIIAFVFIYFSNDASDNFLSQSLKRTSDTFNTENRSSQDRLQFWETHLKIFLNSPLIGDGITLHYIYHGAKLVIYDPHNMFINILVNEGLIGMIINVSIIVWGLIGAWRLFFNKDILIGKTIFLFIIYFITYSTLNTTYTDSTCMAVYFMMLGYMAYFHSITNTTDTEKYDH